MIERVVIVNDDCTESGGAAQIALTSAILLSKRGISVTFLTGDEGVSPKLLDEGINVVSLGAKNILADSRVSAAFRGVYSTRTHEFLSDWVKKNDTKNTIYHLHNWHKILSASSFRALNDVSDRLFITAHDFFLACPNGGYFNYKLGRACELRPLSGACAASNCDKRHYAHKAWRMTRHVVMRQCLDFKPAGPVIIAVHRGMIPWLEKGGVPTNAIKVLRNPVQPWRETRVEAERNRAVLFVGRLDEDKGIDSLARVTGKLGIPLMAVGDGALRSVLKADYPHVQLLGHRSKSEITNLVGDARMVCVPTRGRETFGLVIFEALTSGIPVIVSRSAMAADEIVNSGFGLAHTAGDDDELANCISTLAQNDELVSRMSRTAFSKAKQLDASPDEWVDRLIELYQERLAGRFSVAKHVASKVAEQEVLC